MLLFLYLLFGLQNIPIYVPILIAIIKVCIENVRDTALKAFSLNLAIKIVSMMLLNACIIIENMIGKDMVSKSLLTGADSILFVLGVCIIFLPFIKKHKKRAGTASLLPDTKEYDPSNNN